MPQKMIEPLQSEDVFLADVATARRRPGLHLWWLGQSGFLIAYGGNCVLLDPYLSESPAKKHATPDDPDAQTARRVIDPQKLDFIAALASTHNRTDPQDAQTLKALLDVNPDLVLIVPEANRAFAADRLGIEVEAVVGIDEGKTVEVEGFSFAAVPAAGAQIARDGAGRLLHVGYILRAGPHMIYHSGGSRLYDGMIERLRPLNIDAALLPISGRAGPREAWTFSGVEAAKLAHDIGAKIVVPCHYDLIEFNTASAGPFIAECERLGQAYCVLRNGQRATSELWSQNPLS